METISVSSIDALHKFGIKRVSIAVGVFDGVHLGHRKLIGELLEMAAETRSEPVALTFFPHPKEVLRPDAPPALLMSQEKKVGLLLASGIKAVVTLSFTREFASMSPQDFLKYCLMSSKVKIEGLCVGNDWHFGAGGRGDAALLREYAAKGHFAFRAVSEKSIGGEVVSSTAIRRAVAGGDLDKAGRMLGRPYSITGEVESGRHVAGPELGFPTANVKVLNGVLPPNGVYAGRALLDGAGRGCPAAIAVGVSPTFGARPDHPVRLEAHLIGHEGDLYHKSLEVVFLKRLREERCFSSVEALREQIGRDVSQTKEILKIKS